MNSLGYNIAYIKSGRWAWLMLILMMACGQEEIEFESRIVEGIYEIQVPSLLDVQQNISKNAQLQLGSSSENVYLAVHHTDKRQLSTPAQDWNLDSLYHFHKENVSLSIDRVKVFPTDTLKHPSMKGLSGKIKGTYKGQPIMYRLCVWEGKEYYFQILTWFPQTNANRWQEASDQIMESLKEIALPDTSNVPEGNNRIDSSGLPGGIES